MVSPELKHEGMPFEVEQEENPSLSFGVYLPNYHNPLTNWLIERWQVLTKSRERYLTAADISKKTGVERRFRASPDETVVDMGIKAAEKALGGRKEVDFVMVSSSHPIGVNIAREIASRLKLPRVRTDKDEPEENDIIDIFAYCAGFAYGLHFLKENDERFRGKRILFVSTEKYSDRVLDLEKEREQAAQLDPSLAQTIFSDGATAFLFTYGDDLEVLVSETYKFAHVRNIIRMPVDKKLAVQPCIFEEVDVSPDFFRQEGSMVYEEVRNRVTPKIDSLIERAGIDPEQIQFVVAHQGSGHILDAIQKKLRHKLPFVRDIEDGNFSSASIPKALAKESEYGRIDPNKIILIAGFGAGAGLLASIAAVVMRGARKREGL